MTESSSRSKGRVKPQPWKKKISSRQTDFWSCLAENELDYILEGVRKSGVFVPG